MNRMSKRMAELLITQKGWQPYIRGHWAAIPGKSGYIIGFKEHDLEYRGARETGQYLLNLAKKEEL